MDYIVVKNIGVMEDGTGHDKTTKTDKVIGDQGSVRVVIDGREYVWGPNDSKTLPVDVAIKAAAADSRLRVADERDGFGTTART